jgi:hypothetical protein
MEPETIPARRPVTIPAFVWFVWGPDAACLVQSVRSVRAVAPKAPCHVRVDPDHPLPDGVVFQLLQMGVTTVNPSKSSHGGNLNGLPHFCCQMEELEWAAAGGLRQLGSEDEVFLRPSWAHQGSSGVAVKMDADVILRRLDWLQPMLAPGSEINAAGFRQSEAAPWCGPCYAVRHGVPQLCRDTVAEVLRAGYLRLLLPRGLPEDGTLFAAMKRAHLRGILTLPAWPCPLYFTGCQYDGTPPADSSVLYFGNRHLLGGSDTATRATVAAAMQSAADEVVATCKP